MKHDLYDKWFSPATAFEAEGARCGIAVCRLCASAVLLDPRDSVNAARLHADWHISRGETAPQEPTP